MLYSLSLCAFHNAPTHTTQPPLPVSPYSLHSSFALKKNLASHQAVVVGDDAVVLVHLAELHLVVVGQSAEAADHLHRSWLLRSQRQRLGHLDLLLLLLDLRFAASRHRVVLRVAAVCNIKLPKISTFIYYIHTCRWVGGCKSYRVSHEKRVMIDNVTTRETVRSDGGPSWIPATLAAPPRGST